MNGAFDLAIILRPNWSFQAADHSRRQSAIESKWIADRQHLLAYIKSVRVAHRNNRKRFLGRFRQTNNCQISISIDPNYSGSIFLLAAETHTQFLHVLEAMSISDNVALLIDDRTRAGAFLRLNHQPEESPHHCRGTNINDTGRNRFINLDVVLLVRAHRRLGDVRRSRSRERRTQRLQASPKLLNCHDAAHGK